MEEENVQISSNLAKVKIKISKQNIYIQFTMYSETCLLQTSMGSAFVFGLCLLNWQIFPTLGYSYGV